MSRKQKILVVANRTADSPELIAALRERVSRSPASFTVTAHSQPKPAAPPARQTVAA